MYSIKERLLAFYTQRLVSANQVARLNVGYKQAQVLGLLYTYEDTQKHQAVLRFVDQIKATGKKLYTLCYVATKDMVYDGAFPAFTQQGISLLGRFKDEQVVDFLNIPFDYLYHVDLWGNPILDYLLAKCKAKCRVGSFDTTRAGLFELMIKVNCQTGNHNLDELTAQMLHYTQLLQA